MDIKHTHPIPIPPRIMQPNIIKPMPIKNNLNMEIRVFDCIASKGVEYVFDMPGVLKSSIFVTVATEPPMFTVCCTRISVGKGEVLASFPTEIKYGTMSRQVSLPENVDAYTATSRYNDGTLYVNFKLQKTDVVFVVKVE